MSDTLYENWEPTIGLEIHAQLNTRSKIFCSSANRFGDEPNTNIGVVSTAQIGALPVLNKEAVKKAVMFGCAVGAQIANKSSFDRKSYFYPDSPRNFQITQFYEPIVIGGKVEADVDGKTKTFHIEHAHLEDDAGMLKHFSSFSGVDYNRAGAPLLEIVSTPCMHSPKDAIAYASAVKAILEYIDASNCNMEEGSFRMDVNISVRKKGETELRNKIEIKNLNSFTNMGLAIESEIKRQIREYVSRPKENPDDVIKPATFRFDVEKRETVSMRSKETAKDYRYFPEPDLPPIILSNKTIESIASNLPELPHERFVRYIDVLKLTVYSASILINDKALSDYFEKALKSCSNPKALCNWISVEFVGRMKDTGKTLPKSGILATQIASLVNLIEKGTITGKIAKSIANLMVENPGKAPEKFIQENPDFVPMSDASLIDPLIDEVLSKFPQSIEDYKAGKDKALHHLFGQVMKLCKGTASPQIVKKQLLKKLG